MQKKQKYATKKEMCKARKSRQILNLQKNMLSWALMFLSVSKKFGWVQL